MHKPPQQTKIKQKQIEEVVNLYKTYKNREAKKIALKLLDIEPKNTKVLNLLAIINEALDEKIAAKECFSKILKIDDKDFSAYNNLGLLYFKEYDFENAKLMHEKALEINPNLSTLYINLGNVYLETQNYKNAEILYLKAIELKEQTYNVYFNLAKLYSLTNEYIKADELYEKAVSISSINHDNIDLLHEYSLFCLAKKDYIKGFDFYRYRYHENKSDKQTFLRSLKKLLTKNTDVNNKKLLITYEQGFGDIIQFIRYISLFQKAGAILFVEMKELLLVLMQKSYPEVTFVQKDEMLDYDYHMPLLDAAYFFTTEYKDIPFGNKYLSVDNDDSRAIYNKIFKIETKRKIGIVWRTNLVKGEVFTKQMERISRNCTLDNFLTYFNIPEVQLYSLQVDVTDEERVLLRKNNILSLGDDLVSFYDNALVIDNLDALIAIDTVSSILAGALGKEVLLLLSNSSDWRWTREDDKTNWFNSINIIRQESRGDWTGVFERACKVDLLSTSMDTRERTLKIASGYHQQGNLQEAEKLYRHVLSAEPSNADAFHYLGVIAYQTGYVEKAIQLINQAIVLNPKLEEAHKNIQSIILTSTDAFIQNHLNFTTSKFNIGNFSVRSLKHNLSTDEEILINSMLYTYSLIKTDSSLNSIIILYLEVLRDNFSEGLKKYFGDSLSTESKLEKLEILYKIVIVKGFNTRVEEFEFIKETLNILNTDSFKKFDIKDKVAFVNIFLKYYKVYEDKLDNIFKDSVLPLLNNYIEFNSNAKNVFCNQENTNEFNNFIYITSFCNPLFLNPICKPYFSTELQQLYKKAVLTKEKCFEQLNYSSRNLFMYWYTTLRDGTDEAFVNDKYVLLINDTSDHYHPGCYMTSMGIKQTLLLKYEKVIDIPIHEIYSSGNIFDLVTADKFDDQNNYYMLQAELPIIDKKLCNAQEIIINGEGTLHNKAPHVVFLLYLAYIAKVKYKKRVSIINHSPYPSYTRENRDTVADQIYKKVYDKLDFIGIREPNAKVLMDELNIKSTPTFDCSSIYLDTVDQNLLTNVTPYEDYIVISASVIANHKTIEVFRDFITELINQGKNIVLFNGGPHEEKVFLEKLYKYFESEEKVTFLQVKSVEYFLSVIKNSTMLVSGRFHYSIIAMFLKRPFILLDSNTYKNIGLIKMAQLPTKIIGHQSNNLLKELNEEYIKVSMKQDDYVLSDNKLKELISLAKNNFSK